MEPHPERPRPDLPPNEPDETLESLFRTEAALLRRHLVGMTRDPVVADDLVSEAFLRLAVEIQVRGCPRNSKAWLHRVAVNLAISRARRVSVADRAVPRLLDGRTQSTPEEDAIRIERDAEIARCLATLIANDRDVLLMSARGFAPREIARMRGRSNEATRTHLCRARRRLRMTLVAAGVTA